MSHDVISRGNCNNVHHGVIYTYVRYPWLRFVDIHYFVIQLWLVVMINNHSETPRLFTIYLLLYHKGN